MTRCNKQTLIRTELLQISSQCLNELTSVSVGYVTGWGETEFQGFPRCMRNATCGFRGRLPPVISKVKRLLPQCVYVSPQMGLFQVHFTLGFKQALVFRCHFNKLRGKRKSRKEASFKIKLVDNQKVRFWYIKAVHCIEPAITPIHYQHSEDLGNM